MPVAMIPPRPVRDSRMDQLDALIKSGRGDERPAQYRTVEATCGPVGPHGLARYSPKKRARLESIACKMRERYARRPSGGVCAEPECGRDAKVAGLCRKHYRESRKVSV